MDISTALNSALKIKEILKSCPKHEKLPPIPEIHTTKEILKAHKETMSKCIPFLNKISKEYFHYLSSYDTKSIENRMIYINNKLEEIKKEGEINRLVKEIEEMEQKELNLTEKIVCDEKETMEIINYLHTTEDKLEENSELRGYLQLTYERCKDSDVYERVMKLI